MIVMEAFAGRSRWEPYFATIVSGGGGFLKAGGKRGLCATNDAPQVAAGENMLSVRAYQSRQIAIRT